MLRRWHSLRSDFGRLFHIGPTGRGLDGGIDPNKLHAKDRALWNRMGFLKDFVKPKKTTTNLDVSMKLINNKLNYEAKCIYVFIICDNAFLLI